MILNRGSKCVNGKIFKKTYAQVQSRWRDERQVRREYEEPNGLIETIVDLARCTNDHPIASWTARPPEIQASVQKKTENGQQDLGN